MDLRDSGDGTRSYSKGMLVPLLDLASLVTSFDAPLRHLSGSQTFLFNATDINRAHEWERPIIEETEAGFEIVRIMNANLTHMRRLVRANLKQLDSLEAHFDGLQPPES